MAGSTPRISEAYLEPLLKAMMLQFPFRILGFHTGNGSEFIREALTSWWKEVGSEPIPVEAGSPWRNGYIESFRSRLRDEFLERVEFESVADARAKGGWFRREYNTIRPHSSLGYQTPKSFSDECDRGLHGQPPKGESEILDP